MDRIRVLLVDRNALFREGTKSALSREQDIEIVGEAGDGEQAFDMVKSLMPHVVILDAELHSAKGLELACRIRRHFPTASVITLAASEDDEMLYLALKAGAGAHFAKEGVTAQELVAAVRKVFRGEYVINESLLSRPKVASRVLEQFQRFSLTTGGKLDNLIVPLSPREVDILKYIAHGNSNKQIAHALGLKEQSIKNYVTGILRKLAANDRAHAVFLALRHGWIGTE